MSEQNCVVNFSFPVWFQICNAPEDLDVVDVLVRGLEAGEQRSHLHIVRAPENAPKIPRLLKCVDGVVKGLFQDEEVVHRIDARSTRYLAVVAAPNDEHMLSQFCFIGIRTFALFKCSLIPCCLVPTGHVISF